MPRPDLVFGVEGLVFLVSAFLVAAAVFSFFAAGYAKRQWRKRSRPSRSSTADAQAETDDVSGDPIDHFIPEVETDLEEAEHATNPVEAVREVAHADAGVPDDEPSDEEMRDEEVWERELAA